eukprot:jgi/Botrbrau1/1730/Bobra.116_2s0072.1
MNLEKSYRSETQGRNFKEAFVMRDCLQEGRKTGFYNIYCDVPQSFLVFEQRSGRLICMGAVFEQFLLFHCLYPLSNLYFGLEGDHVNLLQFLRWMLRMLMNNFCEFVLLERQLYGSTLACSLC